MITENEMENSYPSSGSYWRGADGNVYVAGTQGVNSAGTYDSNTDQYWSGQGYSQIADPNPQFDWSNTTNYGAGVSLPSGGTGGITSGSAAPAVDPNVLASYDQAINNTQSGINRLPGQLNSIYSGIESGTKNALNTLLLDRNRGETSFKANKQQVAKDYVGNKNTIGANSGQSLSGLLRLLGSRGAGGSLAATGRGAGTARGEVGRAATLQRGEADNVFGQNNQGLDTNWNNYLTDYGNQVSGVNSQRDQQRQTAQSTIDTNRAGLLQTLAQLQAQRALAAGGNVVGAAQPYLDQANTILDRTSNYTVAPINYNTQAYQAPSVASYAAPPTITPSYADSGANDYFSPYFQKLLGKKQQIA